MQLEPDRALPAAYRCRTTQRKVSHCRRRIALVSHLFRVGTGRGNKPADVNALIAQLPVDRRCNQPQAKLLDTGQHEKTTGSAHVADDLGGRAHVCPPAQFAQYHCRPSGEQQHCMSLATATRGGPRRGEPRPQRWIEENVRNSVNLAREQKAGFSVLPFPIEIA